MTDQVTLNQMLGALEDNIASQVGKKLKKLTKKKQLKAPDDLQQAKLERKVAYSKVSKDLEKWDPIVKRNKKAKLSFPLDRQQDVLAPSAEISFKPMNEFEEAIQSEEAMIHGLVPEQELTTKERKYLKSISAEEAKERLQELQKTRVLLGSFGAKMKQRKKIKSKSYRRLLKQERIKKHVKKVESNEDELLNEIERLQRIRAQERASLRHKNTGKWAKHAKFRAKYDEDARNKLVEQIGVAGRLLNRPAQINSDSDEDSVDDESLVSDDESEGSVSGDEQDVSKKIITDAKQQTSTINDRLIVSNELINSVSNKKRKSHVTGDDDGASYVDEGDDCDDGDADDGDEEDEQRKLMSEAFANDDVVGDFKKLKSSMADEEQPKDIDLYLPGWGDWAGPGIKKNRRKKRKHIIKAKKVDRKDESLNHVIISEKANEEMKEFQIKQMPRGIKNENQLAKIMNKPVVSTFVDQTSHRQAIQPRIDTKMGSRIEPMSERAIKRGGRAKFA